MGALGWKKDFEGHYILTVKGVNGGSSQNVALNSQGISEEIEAKHLLPDYFYEFSLEKPFYQPETVKQRVYTGVNVLEFDKLQPDLFSAILNPSQFWKLLPFSN